MSSKARSNREGFSSQPETEPPVIARNEIIKALQTEINLGAKRIAGLEERERASEALVAMYRLRFAKLTEALARVGNRETKMLALASYLYESGAKDHLTGMLNRKGFIEAVERIRQELAQDRRNQKSESAILIVDIDFFKRINDTYGHNVGDEALKASSRKLLGISRSADVVGRWGGEEFVIFFPGASVKEIYERLGVGADGFARINVNFKPDEKKELLLTISGGMASVRPGEDLEKIIGIADTALYEAKQTGKDRILIAKPEIS